MCPETGSMYCPPKQSKKTKERNWLLRNEHRQRMCTTKEQTQIQKDRYSGGTMRTQWNTPCSTPNPTRTSTFPTWPNPRHGNKIGNKKRNQTRTRTKKYKTQVQRQTTVWKCKLHPSRWNNLKLDVKGGRITGFANHWKREQDFANRLRVETPTQRTIQHREQPTTNSSRSVDPDTENTSDETGFTHRNVKSPSKFE